MTDLQPINEINTRLPSLADVESKLFKLIPALDAFASELAATPIPGSGQDAEASQRAAVRAWRARKRRPLGRLEQAPLA